MTTIMINELHLAAAALLLLVIMVIIGQRSNRRTAIRELFDNDLWESYMKTWPKHFRQAYEYMMSNYQRHDVQVLLTTPALQQYIADLELGRAWHTEEQMYDRIDEIADALGAKRVGVL